MHLYRYLNRLGRNATYCDTYTVIYIQPKAPPQLIETGDNFGDMTSELRPSDSISEFTCAGPKNYAYRVADTVTAASPTVCNVRGIPLNYSASKLVNFRVIRDMILNGDEPSVINVHTEHKNKRKRMGWGNSLNCHRSRR